MNREAFKFRYFFNAGIDRVSGECDVDGTDIFLNGSHIGSVKWKTPEVLSAMTDDELELEFLWNGIFI